jgi:peptide/nickel transport system substrate-binding protein
MGARRTSSLASAALASLAVVASAWFARGQDQPAPAATTGAPESDSIEALAGRVKVDEFNPDVRVKDGSESQPVRGGVLRVRMPGDPKSLNPMCDNDQPSRHVYQYLSHQLAERDRETFEWLPVLARWWAVRDTVLLTDGTSHEGRVLSETDDAVVFAPGASRYTFATCDLATFEEGSATVEVTPVDAPIPVGEVTVVPREGTGLPKVRGRLERPPGGHYTVWVHEAPTRTLTIPRAEIQVVLEGDEGAQEALPALRREVAMDFHLRDGVTWHDGQPVTAADVTFSFDCIQNSAVDAADLKQYFVDLEKYEQTGRLSVSFRFKKQFFLAFGSIADSARIYPRHRFDPDRFKGDPEGFGRYFNAHKDHLGPIGNGPYRFVKWENGRQLEIARNDAWWASGPVGEDGKRKVVVPWIDPERPYLDRIRWIFIVDKQAALKALSDGEVDADFDIEPTTWEEEATNTPTFVRKYVRARFLQPLYTYVGWNMYRKGAGPERQFFADRRVRLAMSLLIPQDRILDEIHYGQGERVSGPFFKYGPFSDRSVEPVPFNVRRAQMLLDEAGWIDHDGDGVRDKDGVPFEFEYLIHNMRDYHQKIADITKEVIERAGVRMQIKKLDWSVFVDTVRDQNFDAVRFAWGEPSCIDADPYQIWHSSQSGDRGSNYISFKNEEADRIILQVRREHDVRKRQVLLRRLHRLLAREQPVTFMFNFYSLYFYARRFHNVRFTIIGEEPYLFSEWYVPREQQGPGG